jgi:hypothetical protein
MKDDDLGFLKKLNAEISNQLARIASLTEILGDLSDVDKLSAHDGPEQRARVWLAAALHAAMDSNWSEAGRHCTNAKDLILGLRRANARLCPDCTHMDDCHDNSTPGTPDKEVWDASRNCENWEADKESGHE